MNARVLIAALLLVVGGGVWACFNPDVALTDCTTACTAATRCGLLPSPLGAAVGGVDLASNCIERCQISSEETRAPILDCLTHDPNDASGTGWCYDPSDPMGSLACDRAATCLATRAGDPILGKADLDLAVVPGGLVEANADSPHSSVCAACNDESCGPGICDQRACGAGFQEESATLWCRILQAADVQSFLLRGSHNVFGSREPCSRMLTRTERFQDLPPGAVRAGIKIRGSSTISDAGSGSDGGSSTQQNYCWVFYGPRVVIHAGGVERAVVPVLDPEALVALKGRWPHTCEDTLEACSDRADNDDNGFADCSDEECAPFCRGPQINCDAGPASDAAVAPECQGLDAAGANTPTDSGEAGP